MSQEHAAEIDHLVVVPDEPGAIVPLAQLERPRSDVDEVLDDMFGEVDDQGPGITDAVLLAGGALAVVAAQIVALPAAVLVGGLTGIGLGSVLPIRSGFRRFRRRRRAARIEALIGRGHLLDTRHAIVRDLVATHGRALLAADELPPAKRLRTRNAAHALVTEVASLLDGHRLSAESELTYTSERVQALRQITAAANHHDADRGLDERRAHVDARRGIEAHAGDSALHQALELTNDLAIDSDD